MAVHVPVGTSAHISAPAELSNFTEHHWTTMRWGTELRRDQTFEVIGSAWCISVFFVATIASRRPLKTEVHANTASALVLFVTTKR